MRTWWISASEGSEGRYHWGEFLTHPRKGGKRWGGPQWIRSPLSHKHIKRMRKGDIVVCYQAREGILGLARLASDGDQSTTEGPFDVFDLAPAPLVVLDNAVPIKAVRLLPHAGTSFEFLRVLRGTAFEVEPKGLPRLVGLLLAYNPGQWRRIGAFLTKARVKLPFRVVAGGSR